MNRRGFLQLLGGTVAGLAIEEAIPFGRVWSFPSKIVIPTYPESIFHEVYYRSEAVKTLAGTFKFPAVVTKTDRYWRSGKEARRLDLTKEWTG
jgi:hypothetical protein